MDRNSLFIILVAAVLTAGCAARRVISTVPGVNLSTELDREGTEILGRYLEASRSQSDALKGVSMEASFDGSLPKLHKAGKMSALRNISRLGQITYKVLGFTGDDTVKKELIARYMTAETQVKDDPKDMAITPDNYKFKYKGLEGQPETRYHRFEVKPRKKRVGLFKGELWVDAKTYLPVRESGHFVKNPSIFLKKVEFTRTYEIKDGTAIPKRIESRVDTRIVGAAELTIEFGNVQRQASQVEPVRAAQNSR